MYSIFDSSVTIDANYSSVTLVYKGNHAALVLESVRRDDSTVKETRFAHFLPNEVHAANNSINSIINTLKDFGADARPARVDMKMINADRKSEFISSLKITHQTSTYQIQNQKQMESLVNRIRDETNGQVVIPQFQLRGVYVNNGVAFNCRSWVREKLLMVGVQIQSNFIDHLSSDTLGSNDYAFCIIQ